MMGLGSLYVSNWQSYPMFHLHAVLIDNVCYAYRGDALQCADRDCLHFIFNNVISAIFKSLHQRQIAIVLCFRHAIIPTTTVSYINNTTRSTIHQIAI